MRSWIAHAMGQGWVRRLVMIAGPPIVILTTVLLVLRHFVSGGMNDRPDVMSLWLPYYCLTGRTLAAGHIPAWNPYVMGGVPLAADPQTGWMYAPAMALFSFFPCDVGIRAYMILLPILAGVGLYAFLRVVGVRPLASLAGATVLSMTMAHGIIREFPFSATVAWTAVMLALAAKLLRARSWPARILWLLALAAAWGQLAAAFLSNGLVLGSMAVILYMLFEQLLGVNRHVRPRDSLVLAGAVLLVLPMVNLAYFLPRLGYLPKTSLGLGYRGLQNLDFRLIGQRPTSALINTFTRQSNLHLKPTWPLSLLTWPGIYPGAAATAVSLAGIRSRQHRPAVLMAGAFGLICYVATLTPVINLIQAHAGTWPIVDFYLHDPLASRYVIVIPLAILVGIGLESLAFVRSSRDLAFAIVPGIFIWWFLTWLMRPGRVRSGMFEVGIMITLLLLALFFRRPRILAGLLSLFIVVELVLAGWIAQDRHYTGLAGVGIVGYTPNFLYALPPPSFPASTELREPALATKIRQLDGGRYISFDPGVYKGLGYIYKQGPAWWDLLANQQSMIFHLEDVQAYNAVAPLRFWEYQHTVAKGTPYSLEFFTHLTPQMLNLFQIAWLVTPTPSSGRPPSVPRQFPPKPVATDGRFTLYGLRSVPARASILTRWHLSQSFDQARALVTEPSFDPSSEVVLEHPPGIPLIPGRSPGTAVYRQLTPESATVDIFAPSAGVVLIRNSYDSNWHATIDGKATQVVPADFVDQGVVTPAGHHVIRLTYQDPLIGYGLLGSAIVVMFMLGLAYRLSSRPPVKHEMEESRASSLAGVPGGGT